MSASPCRRTFLGLALADASVLTLGTPEAAELRRLKQRVDLAGKFSNELWRRYL
jgi:hypothetical protein